MNSLEYISNLERMYKNNFKIIKNKEIASKKFELYAHYQDIAGRTFITKNDIIDKFEVNEYCLVKKVKEINKLLIEDLKLNGKNIIDKIVKPHSEHKKSNITVILVCEDNINDDSVQAIKKFKCEKYHKFYLYGISEIRIIAVDLYKKEVYTSKNGKNLKEIYFKNIKINNKA